MTIFLMLSLKKKGEETMSEKCITVGELIKELEKLPKDFTVEVSVTYDNCEHIQPLGQVYSYKDCKHIDWITLRGKKSEKLV